MPTYCPSDNIEKPSLTKKSWSETVENCTEGDWLNAKNTHCLLSVKFVDNIMPLKRGSTIIFQWIIH